MKFQISDGASMKEFGRALSTVLQPGDLLILTGDLGAGKTTLTQGIGAGLDVRGQVASPTFIIAREHAPAGAGPALVHVDAYRLGSGLELDHLDLDSALEESVTVVEWGEGMVEELAADRLEIVIERPRGHAGEATAAVEAELPTPREVTVRAVGPRWSSDALASALALFAPR